MSRGTVRGTLRAGLASMALMTLATSAQAHLMAANKGTLNLVGDSAYLVLSLPASALKGVDDDGDGLLGTAELRRHAGRIERQVQAGVQLHAEGHLAELQDVMLTLAPPDHRPGSPAAQWVVMGRFARPAAAARGAAWQLSLRLYGTGAAEQALVIAITRKPHAQTLRFTPARPSQALLP